MSIMFLVHFIMFWFQKKCAFFQKKNKNKNKHQNLVKLHVPFHQDNARSDFLRSGCSQMRFVHCAALGSHYDP